MNFKDQKIAKDLPDMNAKAVLYIVEFSGFYKVGVTSCSVEERLSKYPKYKVINTWNFAKRSEALKVENMVVETYHNFKPYSFKNKRLSGASECFRTWNIGGVLQFVEDRLNTTYKIFYIYNDFGRGFHSSIDKCEGIILFKREVPTHIAHQLLEMNQDISNGIDAVSSSLQFIKNFA